MAEFESALSFILENEGGLVENPADPGGITNCGISLRFLRQIPEDRIRAYGIFTPVTDQTIRDLVAEQVGRIYKGEFWDQARFGELLEQYECNYIFDMGINYGLAQGIKLAQRAASCGEFGVPLVEDGILGDHTLHQINTFYRIKASLIGVRLGYIHQLVATNPRNKEFQDGWIRRAYRFC